MKINFFKISKKIYYKHVLIEMDQILLRMRAQATRLTKIRNVILQRNDK